MVETTGWIINKSVNVSIDGDVVTMNKDSNYIEMNLDDFLALEGLIEQLKPQKGKAKSK